MRLREKRKSHLCPRQKEPAAFCGECPTDSSHRHQLFWVIVGQGEACKNLMRCLTCAAHLLWCLPCHGSLRNLSQAAGVHCIRCQDAPKTQKGVDEKVRYATIRESTKKITFTTKWEQNTHIHFGARNIDQPQFGDSKCNRTPETKSTAKTRFPPYFDTNPPMMFVWCCFLGRKKGGSGSWTPYPGIQNIKTMGVYTVDVAKSTLHHLVEALYINVDKPPIPAGAKWILSIHSISITSIAFLRDCQLNSHLPLRDSYIAMVNHVKMTHNGRAKRLSPESLRG